MTTTIEKADQQLSAKALENVLISGDLSKLSAADRMGYYQAVCNSLGLNPLTKPFDYITLNGRLQLYALKAATDQLREKHNISIVITNKEMVDDIYVVTAMATMPDGRTDTDDGAVSVSGLRGEAHANALMKTVTKAKRRVTLSISGLGMLDESEAETIPGARTQAVDIATGEIQAGTPTPRPQSNRPESGFKGVGTDEVASGSDEDGDDPYLICPIHHREWFQKGQMKSPAHNDETTNNEWCNLDKMERAAPHLFVTTPTPPPEIEVEDDEPEPEPPEPDVPQG
tara:strand:+ start:294 stop:1148 length:855 start_codon:yes stop_codon:yes gene_type:complete